MNPRRPAASPSRPIAKVPRAVGVKPRVVGVTPPRVVARPRPTTTAGRGWLLLPVALCAVAGVVYHFQVIGSGNTGTETAALKGSAPSLQEVEATTPNSVAVKNLAAPDSPSTKPAGDEQPAKDSIATTTPTMPAKPAPAPEMAATPASEEKVAEPKSTPADPNSYPGVPRLVLAGTGREADRFRLLEAAKWAAATGQWQLHFDALKTAIGDAAALGTSLQQPSNLEALLALPIPSLALEQAKFIRAVKPETLAAFGREDLNRDFLAWLFERPAILAAFNQTIQPRDKPANALLQWRTIWTDDPPNREGLASLAIACSLVFDQPVRINQNIFGFHREESAAYESTPNYNQKEATALDRFRFYRDSAKKGALKVSLPSMMPWELVWVVDAPVPESELLWAQKNVNFTRHDWGKAYGHIRYRMDRATQGVNPYKAYTLAEIEKEGGICGDQAYFAATTAKANGIPAMVIGGEGDRGAHAWFGYEMARNEWNLNTGRYADNYAAGTTHDPQTGETLKEQELRQWTDPARRISGYDKSEKLLALSKILGEAKRPVQASLAISMALNASNKNYDAWVAHLDDLATAKVPSEDWLRESARARTTFKEFSDLVQELQKREVAYTAANGDASAARQLIHTQTARMGRKDNERTDLILDGVFREADLAAKGSDPEAVGKIYRDALKDKGAEVVAFRKIAERYYNWGKETAQGPETVRTIVASFERKHEEPHGDTFAMGAYRGLLKNLSQMAKEQNLEPLQRRLERREEKLDEEEKKLGKLQSKNADR